MLIFRQLVLSGLAVLALHETPASAAVSRATAVVADISAGTNPYHEVFRRPTWTEHPCTVIPGFPCDVPALNLTFGDDYAADLAADRAVWASYRPGTLYWVPQTNLLLLTLNSFGPSGPGDGVVDATGIHGVATSSAVATACPSCYVLVIQDSDALGGESIQYITDHLPWVDFITNTSPTSGSGSGPGYAVASKAFTDSGRLQFVGAGNYFVYPLLDPQAGDVAIPDYNVPPWLVVVGGALEKIEFAEGLYQCHGVDPDAGKPSDFVGDFAQPLALPQSIHDDLVLTGTSFSTPQIAGRFGDTLRKLRASLGDTRAPGKLWAGAPQASAFLSDGALTGAEMYQLMAAVATYFRPVEFNEACAKAYTLHNLLVPPLPASFPAWPDMGWGFPLAADTDRAVQVLLGQLPMPQKSDNAVTFMQEFAKLRKFTWNSLVKAVGVLP